MISKKHYMPIGLTSPACGLETSKSVTPAISLVGCEKCKSTKLFKDHETLLELKHEGNLSTFQRELFLEYLSKN